MRAVGQHDALGRAVADVALVPEGDVLHAHERVAAQHAGAAGHALAEDRVALVGHGRGPLLALAERLLGLAHLGALQVAHLGGELLDAGADDGDGGEERGVAVALHDLVADGLAADVELLADEVLDAGVDVVVGADGAADLADRGVDGDGAHALEVAADLERPDAELHAEGDRLGVDAVRAPDLHGVAELERAPLEHLAQRDEVALEEQAGALDLQRQRGVEHVAARHPVVDVLAGVADVLGDVGEEGDDVVVGRRLDLVDAGHVERGLGLDLADRVVGDLAELVPGLHGGDLDVEPGLHPGLVGPDRAHLGERVALDHRGSSVVVAPRFSHTEGGRGAELARAEGAGGVVPARRRHQSWLKTVGPCPSGARPLRR